jgi:hypothetical protein
MKVKQRTPKQQAHHDKMVNKKSQRSPGDTKLKGGGTTQAEYKAATVARKRRQAMKKFTG